MKKVLVVGGGLGGLSAALALRQHAIAVDLVEINRQWTVQHDGMVMREHALRAMLEEAGVTVRLGVSFVEMRDLGRAVGVSFSDNTSGGYDLVVGADGAGSKVRELLFGDTRKLNGAAPRMYAELMPCYKGRVVLIGDAVYPFPPRMGRGAAQAIEDGSVLGQLCAQRMPVEEMLATFVQRRHESRQRPIAEGEPAGLGRRLVAHAAPAELTARMRAVFAEQI